MAKMLKDILGMWQEAAIDAPHHGREDAEGEVEFKKVHTDNVNIKDYPVDAKKQFKADSIKKDKSKPTHMAKSEEEDAYEHVNAEIEKILMEENEVVEGVMEQLKAIAESGEDAEITLNDDTVIEVDSKTASAVIDVMEFLNDNNKQQFEDKIEANQEDFLKMVDFAIQMRGGE